jgi:hypothetical protein
MNDEMKGFAKAQVFHDARMPDDNDLKHGRKCDCEGCQNAAAEYADAKNDEHRDDAREWGGREYP